MTTASEFSQLQRAFKRFNNRQSPSRIFRESLRNNNRLRRFTRGNPLGRTGVNSASLIGSVLLDEFFNAPSSNNSVGGLGDFINTPIQGVASNSASGLGGLFSNKRAQNSAINILTNVFEGLFSELTTKTRTTTVSRESERSSTAASRWNTSRRQQDAELAAIVQRGLSNL